MAFIRGHYHKKFLRYQSVKQDWRLQKDHHFAENILQMHFLKWKLLHFDLNITEMYSQWSSWKYIRIGSLYDVAPNRQQAMIWTNDAASLSMHICVTWPQWVNKDFLTWHLIGWWLCCQPIRSHVWKFLLINMDFEIEIPGPRLD